MHAQIQNCWMYKIMKRFRFIISLIALLAGAGMVGISLTSASRVYSSDGVNASQMQLYLGDQVLPDHLLYPAYMAGDRVKLELASQEEKVFLMMDYADRRLLYARKLIEKDNKALALTTLTKSQKYLNAAAQLVSEANLSDALKKEMVTEIDVHTAEVKSLFDHFDTHDKAVLERLCDEALIWQGKITDTL
jgi:hypothetical protein